MSLIYTAKSADIVEREIHCIGGRADAKSRPVIQPETRFWTDNLSSFFSDTGLTILRILT
jgi:hypothetical protein